MYAASVADASTFVLLMVLITWICAVAMVAAVVLLVAWWALTKAESKDVPEVLAGLAHLLRAASWPKDLTGLLGRSSMTRAPSPQPAPPDAGQVAGDALPDGRHDHDDHQAGDGR